MPYEPTANAKAMPRQYQLPSGSWVGIGGVITITPTPPAVPFQYPEASQEQYKILYEQGHTHLVKLVPDVQPKKSDTKADKG
jgi:hypothetical protein